MKSKQTDNQLPLLHTPAVAPTGPAANRPPSPYQSKLSTLHTNQSTSHNIAVQPVGLHAHRGSPPFYPSTASTFYAYHPLNLHCFEIILGGDNHRIGVTAGACGCQQVHPWLPSYPVNLRLVLNAADPAAKRRCDYPATTVYTTLVVSHRRHLPLSASATLRLPAAPVPHLRQQVHPTFRLPAGNKLQSVQHLQQQGRALAHLSGSLSFLLLINWVGGIAWFRPAAVQAQRCLAQGVGAAIDAEQLVHEEHCVWMQVDQLHVASSRAALG